jgi:nitrogen regulatory protein PII
MSAAVSSDRDPGPGAPGGTLLLNLIVSPEVADAVAEWLLERQEVPGFTSLPVSGHGSSEHSLSLAEQVAGRSRRVMFFTYLPEESARVVLDGLRQAFRGSGLHYWMTAVIACGHLE